MEATLGTPCSSTPFRGNVDLDLHLFASDRGRLVLHILNSPWVHPKSSKVRVSEVETVSAKVGGTFFFKVGVLGGHKWYSLLKRRLLRKCGHRLAPVCFRQGKVCTPHPQSPVDSAQRAPKSSFLKFRTYRQKARAASLTVEVLGGPTWYFLCNLCLPRRCGLRLAPACFRQG